MKRMAQVGALLLMLAVGLPAQAQQDKIPPEQAPKAQPKQAEPKPAQPKQEAPLKAARPEGEERAFLGKVRVGQRVILTSMDGGYYLVIEGDIPRWIVGAGTQAAIEQAEARRALLAETLREYLRINRRVPNAVPENTVERLPLRLDRATEQLRWARRQAARPDVWTVSALERNYIGLRSGDTRMRIRLGLILGVIWQTGEGAAKEPAQQQ